MLLGSTPGATGTLAPTAAASTATNGVGAVLRRRHAPAPLQRRAGHGDGHHGRRERRRAHLLCAQRLRLPGELHQQCGPPADAMVNLLSHEQDGVITDPFGTAWYDSSMYEDEDERLPTSAPSPSAPRAGRRAGST